MAKKIKIKDKNMTKEVEVEKGKPTFVKPEDGEVDKIIGDQLNAKRENKLQAMKNYFRNLVLYKKNKSLQQDIERTIESEIGKLGAHNSGVNEDALLSEAEYLTSQVHPDFGVPMSVKTLKQMAVEFHIELRIQGRSIEEQKVQLLKDFGVDEDELATAWTEWFV